MKKNIQYIIIICLFSYFFCSSFQSHAQQAQKTISGQGQTQGVELPPVDICLIGNAKLTNGAAEIVFDKKYAQGIPENIQVLITPIGSWSGIFVFDLTSKGFKVKSETGDTNAAFSWVLIGERPVEPKIVKTAR